MARCYGDGEAVACERRGIGAFVLSAVRRCFRRFPAKNELEGLSERDLRDLGVERREIAAAVDRANTALHVKDFRARG